MSAVPGFPGSHVRVSAYTAPMQRHWPSGPLAAFALLMIGPALAAPTDDPNPELDVPEPAPPATSGWYLSLDIAAASLESELEVEDARDEPGQRPRESELRSFLPLSLSAGHDFVLTGPIVLGVAATVHYSYWTVEEEPEVGLPDGDLHVFGAGPTLSFGAWLLELDDVSLQIRFRNSLLLGFVRTGEPIDVGIGAPSAPYPYEVDTFAAIARVAMDVLLRFGKRPAFTLGVGGAILAPIFSDEVEVGGETYPIEFGGPLVTPVHVHLGYAF